MKIQLPGFVLAGLYKNSLVMADDVQKQQPDEPQATPAAYLGDNNQKIAIVVQDVNNRFLGEESLKLLVNMLTALQFTLQDVAIINIEATPFTYKEIAEQFQSRVCLMFNVTTQQIGLPFQMPDYKVQSFGNCKFLSSASLDKMKGNGKEAKVEKTKLWMCLKSIFE